MCACMHTHDTHTPCTHTHVPHDRSSAGPVCVEVGERVEVFWPGEGTWFVGTVVEVDVHDSTYKVLYDIDQEEHWHGEDMDVRSL